MFQADTKYIPRGVYVSIETSATFGANPVPYTKLLNTSRSGLRQGTAGRADLGTESFVDDDCFRSMRNRFVLDHSAKHRPSGIADGFRHFSFFQSGRADIPDCDEPVLLCNSCTFDMQEVSALPGDLCGQPSSAVFLPPPLVHRQFLGGRPEELRRLDLGSVAQCGERFQAEVDTDRGAVLSLSIRQLDLDVDKPMPLAVASEVPGLRNAVLGDFTGQPKTVGSSKKGQSVIDHPRWTFEVGKRHPVQVALGRPEARRLRETSSTAIREPRANSVNGVGVDTEFLGHTTAQIGKIEGGRPLDVHASAVSGSGNPVCLCTVVPKKITGAGLRSERTTNGLAGIFYSVAKREYHRKGRLSGNNRNSSRDRVTRQTFSVPTNLSHFCFNNKGARFLPGLKAEVSAQNIR
jgi:hypothetical protein